MVRIVPPLTKQEIAPLARLHRGKTCVSRSLGTYGERANEEEGKHRLGRRQLVAASRPSTQPAIARVSTRGWKKQAPLSIFHSLKCGRPTLLSCSAFVSNCKPEEPPMPSIHSAPRQKQLQLKVTEDRARKEGRNELGLKETK